MSLHWQKLHELIGVSPDENLEISFTGVQSLDDAGPSEVSFLGNSRYKGQLRTTSAGAVLVSSSDYDDTEVSESVRLIKVDNPSGAFSKVVDYFLSASRPFEPGLSPGAYLGPDTVVDLDKVQLGPGVVVEQGAQIGDGSVIHAGCLIGRDVVIGEDCILHPGVVVREGCQLGNRVILQPGCVIGSDGYGFDLVEGRHQKVPQVGIVEIEDDVEIGANACIDRARFGRTLIRQGTKVDNLVQIAHNVEIGEHCLVVAQSGIAGSSNLGNYVTIAAQAGVAGHLQIAGHSVLTAQSGLLKNISEPGAYMGTPARPMRSEQKKIASLSRLSKLREEVQILKKKLEELTGE